MPRLEPQELAVAYMGIWNAGADALLDTYATDDITIEYEHFEAPYRGTEDCRAMLRTTHGFFPDLRITIHELVACGARVTVRWSYAGTHRAGTLFGVEASGRRVEVPGLSILTAEEGLIRYERGVVDNLLLALQVGALG